METKLIIFDLFGTLIFPNPKVKKEDFFVFYKSLGIKIESQKDFEKFSKIFTKAMKSSSSWQELSQKVIEEILGEKSKEKIETLAKFLSENLVYQKFDDVEEILNLPPKKAILTDGSKFLFSNLGLERHFQIFTPKETKFEKPDERAFLAVLEFFKVKPEKAIMVGDEIERDILPAKKLAIKAILIDRENKIQNYDGIKINSLRELKKYLNCGPVV